MATTEAIHTLQIAGWAVKGPYKYAGDLRRSFRIEAPGRLVAVVYCVDGDLASTEDEAIVMALAALENTNAR